MTAGSVRIQLVLLVGCFLLAAGFVDLVRRHALRRRQLDMPNERSSHTVPTPRGGGLGVVVGTLLAGIHWLLRFALGCGHVGCKQFHRGAAGVGDRRLHILLRSVAGPGEGGLQ